MLTLFRYFRRKTKAHHVDAYSAQAAFFLLLSLVPLLLLVFFAAKLFSVSEEMFPELISNLLPQFMHQWIIEIMHDVLLAESAGTTWISAIAVIWSASKCVYYIIGGLNTIFELKEHRTYWTLRAVSILYTFVMILAVVFSLLMMVLGTFLSERIVIWFPAFSKHLSVLLTARYAIGLVVLTIFFAILYKGLPSSKFSIGEMLPGAVVSAVGWIVFSSLFAFYIENFSNYSHLYGGLTSIVIFMLWLYVSMQILFFGAELNLLLQKIR